MVFKLIKNLLENRRREKLRQQLMHGKLRSEHDAQCIENIQKGFYQTQMGNSFWQDLFGVLAKFCNNRALVLDVGCGAYELIAVSNQENTIGTDLSKMALKTLKRFGFKGQTVLADALHLPFKTKVFDCLISNQMIEHLLTAKQIKAFIEQIEEVAYDIMIVTPNAAYGRQVNDPTHFHFFTTRKLKPLVPDFQIFGCSPPFTKTLQYYLVYDSPKLVKMPVIGKVLYSLLCKIDDSRLMNAVNRKLWPCVSLVAVKVVRAKVV